MVKTTQFIPTTNCIVLNISVVPEPIMCDMWFSWKTFTPKVTHLFYYMHSCLNEKQTLPKIFNKKSAL